MKHSQGHQSHAECRIVLAGQNGFFGELFKGSRHDASWRRPLFHVRHMRFGQISCSLWFIWEERGALTKFLKKEKYELKLPRPLKGNT